MLASSKQRAVDARLAADPTVSANIYCKGSIDELLIDAMRGFRDEVYKDIKIGPVMVWFMRYRRGGEHLKVRVHASDEDEAAVRRILEKHVSLFLNSLPCVADETTNKLSGALDPPIDIEDNRASDHPNQQMVWTNYGRSHVSFCGKPFLDDDYYVRIFVACLNCGADRVLEHLSSGGDGRVLNLTRQAIIWRLLIETFAALKMSETGAAEYLTYHRDWLIRFVVSKLGKESKKVSEVVRSFDQRVSSLGTRLRSNLTTELKAALHEDGLFASIGEATGWQTSIQTLSAYVAQLVNDPEYHIDPNAQDPKYPPLFKVLHGTANQAGLPLLDEAFAYHILLSCLDRSSES